jgi:cellulose synthase/poly-beta-1,6-N-acetylglucosamine synthase-like glycosyltransferase
MYKEPYEVVRESFESLCGANYPKEKMMVVLAVEERAAQEAGDVAERIKKDFHGRFGALEVTVHPRGIPGELPGKGANEAWAAKEARRILIDGKIEPENVLVSSFDIDTQIFPEYFGRLTYVFLSEENRSRAIYQPIPFFTNNVYQSPAIARVISFSSTFWQMMQQSRPERLTSFSSQSIPLKALMDMGYWHTDVVSEDSRVFWQGYLTYHGDFRVVPLHYPVSMDANVAHTLWGTLKNLYKQQRRWGWGCENIPYMLDGFKNDRKIPAAKKRYWTFQVLEGFHSWATNSIMIFALGWLPVYLGGKSFNLSLLSHSLPDITRFIIQLSMLGIASSAVLGIMLLPPKPAWFKPYHYALYVLQWALIPVSLIVFGAIPGLEAQTRLMLGGRFRLGFWVTPKHRK